MYDAEEN